MSPEEKARIAIDVKLKEAGYILQDLKDFNPVASLGVVVREFPTHSGPVDYLIFIRGVPVGVIEAKASHLGEKLGMAAEQSLRYIKSGLKHFAQQPEMRFAYEATDELTYFCDYVDEKARTRALFSFHRPEQLNAWLHDESTLRNRLKKLPPFDQAGFRPCQTSAILRLEESFALNKPRALIQMATGAGKTWTAITAAYRLLRFAGAKRILFLVDTKNLGEQAESEFLHYKPNDDPHLFSELYNVARLKSSFIPESAQVCISTIQRMYSILRGEEMDEAEEQVSMNENDQGNNVREVVYNPKYPCEFFDFIIIDECHRSIYNIWQQVPDYFDAFLVGLTATPDKRTLGFFNENIVSEYTHEQAVIDDVNVPGDVYVIETDITANGGTIVRQLIEKRDRLSRKKRWEQLDDDIVFSGRQLDRDVVNTSQIRHVIKAFKHAAETQIFPQRINPETGRFELPKTLVFAKTDSHADDIIRIIREEFGEGNEFCKKITCQAQEDPKSVLSAFRNAYYPRIAVTVDMIATGTDVKALECLLFMRDVRSRNYFEQMKGRGTRTLDNESLRLVTPSARERKLGYVLVDAVGVTRSLKTDSRPLERQPGVSLKDLLMMVAVGNRDADTLISLANRLLRLDKILSSEEQGTILEITEGKRLRHLAAALLNVDDPDVIEYQSIKHGCTPDEARTQLVHEAAEPFFNATLRQHIIKLRQTHDQIIDTVNIDTVTFSGWDESHQGKALDAISSFHQFMEDNKHEIAALSIIYNQSWKQRPLTLKLIKEVAARMQEAPYRLSIDGLWNAYALTQPEHVRRPVNEISQLADIISMIRFEWGQTAEINPFSAGVRARFQQWTLARNAGNEHFTEEQMMWLRDIRDHVMRSIHIGKDDFDYVPFASRGGLGKFYQLFGSDYESLLVELNGVLVA